MGKIDGRFLEIVRQICRRPGMYVGTESFEKVASFLDGYAAGLVDLCGNNQDHFLHKDFQRFLFLKYGMEAARRRAEVYAATEEPENGPLHSLYGNVVWSCIYDRHFEGESDKSKLSRFLSDFEDFANPLTRMAIEVQ